MSAYGPTRCTFPNGTTARPGSSARPLPRRRGSDNTVCLAEGSVSTHHAELPSKADACGVKDLGSTNRTFIEGKQSSKASCEPMPGSRASSRPPEQGRSEFLGIPGALAPFWRGTVCFIW